MFKAVVIVAFIGVTILLSPAGNILADNAGEKNSYPVRLETTNEASAWFEANKKNICYGFGGSYGLYCEASYAERMCKVKSRLPSITSCSLIIDNHLCKFYEFDDSVLSGNFTSFPGDTVLIIGVKGKAKAIIKHIGYFDDGCNSDVGCNLELTDYAAVTPTGKYLVLMGNLAYYSGPIIPYSEYQPADSRLITIADSLKTVLNNSYKSFLLDERKEYNPDTDIIQLKESVEARWRKLESYYRNSEMVNARFYGIDKPELPDTLFVFVSSSYGGSESSWSAGYRLININGSWHLENLREPIRGAIGTRIICALDLNGDGEPEYLIDDGTSIGLSTMFDGAWESIGKGARWGC